MCTSWPILGFGVVRRNRSATRHPTSCVHLMNDRRAQLTAHVVEVTVNALRCDLSQCLTQISSCLVVNDMIEAELLLQPTALVVGASKPDNRTALDLTDLPNNVANGSGCSGHDQHFAALGLTDLQQSEVCCEAVSNNKVTLLPNHGHCFFLLLPRNSQHSNGQRRRMVSHRRQRERLDHVSAFRLIENGVRSPTKATEHVVAHLVVGVAALEDP